MTKARPWPNNALHDLRQAIGHYEVVICEIDKLQKRVNNGRFDRTGLMVDLLLIGREARDGLRHLERHNKED